MSVSDPAVTKEPSAPESLHAACAQGRLDAVKRILEEAKKQFGQTEKEEDGKKEKEVEDSSDYCYNNNDWQAYLSAKDERGRTPLVWAVAGTFADIVIELLRAGADPTLKDDKVTFFFNHEGTITMPNS